MTNSDELKITITPDQLKAACTRAWRNQEREQFKEPFINYLGWEIFGVVFPAEAIEPEEL